MAKKIKIYTLSYCPYCKRAKELLTRKGISFEEIDVTADPDARAKIEEETGWDTLPIVLIGNELIGGSEELLQLDASGELDKKLLENS